MLTPSSSDIVNPQQPLSPSAPVRNLATSENLRAALEVAAQGVYVFPALATYNEKTRKLDKKPAIADWQMRATTDSAQLRDWWTSFPAAIPGIELGRSSLFVVDLDRHPEAPDGVAAFKAFRGDNPVPQCPTTETPSGGWHLYFKQPESEPLTNLHRDAA